MNAFNDFTRDLARIAVHARIANATASGELKLARALGAGWFEANDSATDVLHEVYALARGPMPPLTLTRFRP